MKNLLDFFRFPQVLISSSALSLAFCLLLLSFRVVYTGSITFLFLGWNLILAIIPYIFVKFLPEAKKLKTQLALLMLGILFLPNAPYIITDLFHLRLHTGPSIWFDTLLIVSFAWCGLLFFFKSMSGIEHWLSARMKRSNALVSLLVITLLCGFGIYIGRYLRFNSWDVISAPGSLLAEIADRLLHPRQHMRTWGLTFSYGVFLMLTYLTVGRRLGLEPKKARATDYTDSH